jgi:hypothetical protein
MEVITMIKLKSDLLREKFTAVYHEAPERMQFGAPHHFSVSTVEEPKVILADIHFQEGPILECGVNGVHNEDLLAMVICRLEHFQRTPYACRENALAITKLEEAMMWLRKRTDARTKRGVEGTHTV